MRGGEGRKEGWKQRGGEKGSSRERWEGEREGKRQRREGSKE